MPSISILVRSSSCLSKRYWGGKIRNRVRTQCSPHSLTHFKMLADFFSIIFNIVTCRLHRKKTFRYSRPQPGCHLSNSPWAGIMTSYINYRHVHRLRGSNFFYSDTRLSIMWVRVLFTFHDEKKIARAFWSMLAQTYFLHHNFSTVRKEFLFFY